MTGPLRLAIVASHPIQHFCPLYREIARDPRVQLKVFFASAAGARPYYDEGFGRDVSWGDGLTDGFDHEFLLPQAGAIPEAVAQAQVRVALSEFRPDVVQVYGYGDRLSRRALAWCVRQRVPAVMMADSELVAPRSGAKRLAKQLALRLLLRLPAGFLTIGDENERYYRNFGVPAGRMHRSPIPIDSDALDVVLADRDDVRVAMRDSWQVAPDEVVLLAVGKSIPRKRHKDLVEAVGRLPGPLRSRVVVALAGGGESTDSIMTAAEECGVRLLPLGFVPVSRLLETYVGADIMVHPSEADPHPLSIAEAVYAGLPVIVSDRVGSWGLTDDVRPGLNGLRHPVGDVEALSRLLAIWIDDPALRVSAGRASSEIGQTRTLNQSALTYVDGIVGVSRR